MQRMREIHLQMDIEGRDARLRHETPRISALL
jgi:hypothetical protein